MPTETTTCTVSRALKAHLHKIKGENNEYAVDGVSTLHGALAQLLDEPYAEQIEVEGYDETLDEPVKVPESLLDRIKEYKEEFDAQDYEETLRERANIEHREQGERPIEVTKL